MAQARWQLSFVLFVAQDPYVMATFHHYDPWTFCGDNLGTYDDNWTDTNLSSPMDTMLAWSQSTGKGMPVYIGEWGVGWGITRNQEASPPRSGTMAAGSRCGIPAPSRGTTTLPTASQGPATGTAPNASIPTASDDRGVWLSERGSARPNASISTPGAAIQGTVFPRETVKCMCATSGGSGGRPWTFDVSAGR